MSQISPPVRILLAATLLFAVVWMLLLKPGGATPAASTEAAATPAATAAAATAAGASSSTSTAAAPTGTSTAAGTQPGAEAIASSRLPSAVKRAIKRDDVVVLYFWNPRAADDRAVERELAHVPARPGKVLVRSVPVSRVAAYQGIARGVDLKQSPTVVVIDRDLQATALVGYVDHTTIDQAIQDALRVR